MVENLGRANVLFCEKNAARSLDRASQPVSLGINQALISSRDLQLHLLALD